MTTFLQKTILRLATWLQRAAARLERGPSGPATRAAAIPVDAPVADGMADDWLERVRIAAERLRGNQTPGTPRRTSRPAVQPPPPTRPGSTPAPAAAAVSSSGIEAPPADEKAEPTATTFDASDMPAGKRGEAVERLEGRAPGDLKRGEVETPPMYSEKHYETRPPPPPRREFRFSVPATDVEGELEARAATDLPRRGHAKPLSRNRQASPLPAESPRSTGLPPDQRGARARGGVDETNRLPGLETRERPFAFPRSSPNRAAASTLAWAGPAGSRSGRDFISESRPEVGVARPALTWPGSERWAARASWRAPGPAPRPPEPADPWPELPSREEEDRRDLWLAWQREREHLRRLEAEQRGEDTWIA